MLMLEDLNKHENLVESLKNALKTKRYAYVICNGKDQVGYPTKKLSSKQIVHCEKIFIESKYVFVGVSHSNVMFPLFALTPSEKEGELILKEYLTVSKTNDDVIDQELFEDDLTKLAIVVSFLYPGINKVNLPMIIKEFENQECVVINQAMELKKSSGL